MLQADLIRIKEHFSRYVAGFYDMDPEGLRNIRLKEEHTLKVAAVMDSLTEGEEMTEQQRLVAAACAICHDLGRFPQYRRWRTFRDSESDNHARLSVEVIREERFLDGLSADEQEIVEEAVRFHNLFTLPEQSFSSKGTFIRLIRDADKLDIWRVFLEYFHLPEEERASAAGLGLPDLPEVTPPCLGALAAGTIVRLDQARVLNDFKLLQISWVYDLNFVTSYHLLLEQRFLEQVAETLPDTKEVREAVKAAFDHAGRIASNIDRRRHARC